MLQKASEAWRDSSIGKVHAQGPRRSDLQLLHERGVWSCISVSLVLGRKAGRMAQSLEMTG